MTARRTMTRRSLALGGLGGVAAAGAGVVTGVLPGRAELRSQYHDWFSPHPHIPRAPEGEIKLVQVYSHARGQTVDLFTAVPHGHGDGAGLPVCMVLHGVTATPSDYQRFGLGRFLTAAVQRGAPPFVLAGASGGVLWWEPDASGNDNPAADADRRDAAVARDPGFRRHPAGRLGLVDGRIRRPAAGRGAPGLAACRRGLQP